VSVTLPMLIGGAPTCRDCAEQGRGRVRATRMMKSGPRCEDHFRQVAGMPPLRRIQEVKRMPKVRTDVDWDEVRSQKLAGASATELAEKFGVHVSSIYLHVKPNGTKPAGGGKSGRTPKPGRPASSPISLSSANGGSSSSGVIGDTLARLRQERDRIEKAITALEAIET
jgi:hypothetical protein